ncbi:MAG: hypothetical protein WCC17_12575 [Candidatus Nitrosopolaris sp.]|jgi:hypothetical protein
MPEIKTTATDTLEQDKKCHSNPPRRVTPAAFVDEGREQLMIRRNIGLFRLRQDAIWRY